MKVYWILFVSAFPFLSQPVLASDISSCPVESVVGQIGKITGPADQVFILRGGRRLPAQARQCLMYGDKLAAGQNTVVDIISVSAKLQIGQGQKATTWSAPEPPQGLHPHFLTRLNAVLAELIKNPAEFSYFGASRGASYSCEDPDQEATKPLLQGNSIPAIAQRLGADIAQIVVAWQPESGSGDVSLALSNRDGKVLAKKRICRRSHGLLDIPPGAVRAGDELVLEARDANGSRLEWHVSIVNQAQMPQPKEPISAAWVLGAWRLIETGAEYRLDSIARLSTGAEQSFVAQKLIDAVYANEVL